MIAPIPKVEIFLYLIVWIFSFSFAYYKVYLLGIIFEKSTASDLVNGWSILHRKKDNTDEEWELWTTFSFQLVPWILVHMFISEITRYFSIEAIPLVYSMITLFALLCYFPAILSAYLIIQLSLFFIGMLISSKTIVWIIGIFSLLFLRISNDAFMETSNMNYEQSNLASVLLAWFLIRCLDFTLSEIDDDSNQWTKFLNLMAYSFYLPCFFFGPFIPYNYFKSQIYKTQPLCYRKRIYNLCLTTIKYFLYYLFLEFLSHFLYCNAMHYYLKDLILYGIWTLSGIGLCMANFFYLKYIIIYGFSTCIAKYENFITPDGPKCIYRIHLYSKMWRHFDRGFYLFMFRCIYAPVCGGKNASYLRKSFASFLCFLFVYNWHGSTLGIFYWSSLNFFGLIFEAICQKFWKSDTADKFFVSKLSQGNLRRLQALLASPLWILAVVSNFMFFGDHEMGIFFIEQLLKGSVIFYITLIIIAYSMCQVSIETDKLENQMEE